MRAGLRVLYRNLPNIASVLGVVPLCALFLPGGSRYLVELIFYTNLMDDVDGTLARELDLKSDFGGALDNVCDATGHVLLVMATGAYFGSYVLAASIAAAIAILVRITKRVYAPGPNGSPTNELLRHLFLVLVAQRAGMDVAPLVAVVMAVHAVTMVCPFPMPHLLRTRATTTVPIALLDVLLAVAYFVPQALPVVAAPFVGTYVYTVAVGAAHAARAGRARAGEPV